MEAIAQQSNTAPEPIRLHIRYRSGEDEVTERDISDVVVEPPNTLHAFCHLRGERRSFYLYRIEHAVNLATGEIIPDIWRFFALPSLKPLPPRMPVFAGRPTPMSVEEAQRQRAEDKQALFRPFKLPVIEETVKRRLWALFDERCFRCGDPGPLEFDHHVPQYLGGRLVPGNIVLLCHRCNALKGDTDPRVFYPKSHLDKLAVILQAELKLFDFYFDWTRWTYHPGEYLASLGVPARDIERALRDRSEPDACSPQTNAG